MKLFELLVPNGTDSTRAVKRGPLLRDNLKIDNVIVTIKGPDFPISPKIGISATVILHILIG